MKSHDLRRFDPALLARLDADMWVAYYNHQFAKLTWLLVRLAASHFRLRPIAVVRASYHSALAAIVFRKTKGHEDSARVLKHLVHFYHLLSRYNVTPFDYQRAAELELAWWMVDRYPERYNTTRANALAEGMAVMYLRTPAELREYGQKRAAAMELLDAYHYDTDATVDWPRLRALLKESYQALYDALQ